MTIIEFYHCCRIEPYVQLLTMMEDKLRSKDSPPDLRSSVGMSSSPVTLLQVSCFSARSGSISCIVITIQMSFVFQWTSGLGFTRAVWDFFIGNAILQRTNGHYYNQHYINCKHEECCCGQTSHDWTGLHWTCLDLGCCQVTLLNTLPWKYVLMILSQNWQHNSRRLWLLSFMIPLPRRPNTSGQA